MFQDIGPHVFSNEYSIMNPGPEDIMIVQRGRELLVCEVKEDADEAASCGNHDNAPHGSDETGRHGNHENRTVRRTLPTAAQIGACCPEAAEKAFYLFSIDRKHFFCAGTEVPETDELKYASVMVFRELEPDHMGFGGAVGWQLASWYDLHRYCGRCGTRTVRSDKERAILCPSCGHAYYPRISPVVIIAVVDGDRILLTRYNRAGYRRHALVAGFVEIGETLEDAVEREIMEEVGLHVKNIRYCESQPWPFSSSLIAGFFADVDGDPTIHLNTDGQEELSEGVWIQREDLVLEDSNLSLTWDMIRKFKENRYPL